MDLKDLLKKTAEEGMGSIKESVANMSLDRRKQKCYKWHSQGISKKVLADYFEVTERTIYSWLKDQNQGLLEELEVKTGLELLIEQFADLEQFEKLCMYEASHLGQSQIDIDPETGETKVKNGSSKGLDQKVKFMALAKDFRKMQIDLLTQTGLIPKQAEKIYQSVNDNKAEIEKVDRTIDIDKNELSKTVLEKLMTQTNL